MVQNGSEYVDQEFTNNPILSHRFDLVKLYEQGDEEAKKNKYFRRMGWTKLKGEFVCTVHGEQENIDVDIAIHECS